MERIKNKEILSERWGTLSTYQVYLDTQNGGQVEATREVYDTGDGVGVLLYNTSKNTIVLVRQFRLTAYLKCIDDGLVLECTAGLLEGANPVDRVIAETMEETGFVLHKVTPVYRAFASPGAHMEEMHLYIAEVDASMREGQGGGLLEENENIEVVEIDFPEAVKNIGNGSLIDLKTIVLLQYLMLHCDKLGLKL